ncbi:hypothetical protein [Dokdonella sp.]|uniref:hypothetical protein n=1 Tax=Dokdonella sp. TaxID=2291710 RepID=UPI0025B87646|nr:hypothetical protein [Dokdonella sp.]MBX3687929.1 hypothetical protein [Dokdonella sp.]
MRTPSLIILAAALCACAPSTPEAPPAKAPEAKPVPAAAADKPAEPVAAAPAKEVPEGDCGDQSAVAADQRVANTARWTTASEQNNFGFDVFRGDAQTGPFTKLTKEPILGAGTSDETHKYEYRDDSIDPCKDYWYYVEGITTSGSHERFTPTFHAPAKRRARGSAATPAPANPPAPAAVDARQ